MNRISVIAQYNPMAGQGQVHCLAPESRIRDNEPVSLVPLRGEKMAVNMIGTTDHLRMAKSVLTDLRNRGYEEHASLIFAGDEEKVNCLDNIISDSNGQNADRDSFDAGIVEINELGLVASIGPAFGFLADSVQSPTGGIGEVCHDMGIRDEGKRLIEQWLKEGKYVLVINGTEEDQIDFLKKQVGELQGIDHLTMC